MTNHEIVQKLIGPIRPVGSSHVDTERFANLEAMIELVNKLLFDIDQTALCATRQEASMKKAGKRAKVFLEEIADAYEED